MTTIPLYALHPNAKVALIRRGQSLEGDPVGYVFWVELQRENSPATPLVLTINGTRIDREGVHATLSYLRNLYPGQTPLVAQVRELTNFETIRESLNLSLEPEPLPVHSPSGWSRISEEQQKLRRLQQACDTPFG